MSRTRKLLFGSTLVLYAVIVAAVLVGADLVRLDWQVMLFRPYKQWPQVHAFLDYFVVLGQRGPTAVLVAAWLGWRSWRQRTLRPLLALATSLLALNATVGAVKIGLGRLGPHYATTVGSAELFRGGDIFPSGHTANAVVTWGILAYLATTPVARRVLSVVSTVFALGVGATTVYLGTHWVSDVLLGWAAGLLILLGLPWLEPAIARAEALLLAWQERLAARRRARLAAPAHEPVSVPAHVPAGQAARDPEAGAPALSLEDEAEELLAHDEAHDAAEEAPAREPAGTSSGTGFGARLHHGTPRQHPLRGERPAVAPHPPRTAPLGPHGK
jgi:membrane-associated phospholipid phosphatase